MVYKTLCEYDELEPGIFPMSERVLVKRERPCGMLFRLHGPRRVQYTAVWETSSNTILCYGSTGERYRKIRADRSPGDRPHHLNVIHGTHFILTGEPSPTKSYTEVCTHAGSFSQTN